jgi:hypothetical protein
MKKPLLILVITIATCIGCAQHRDWLFEARAAEPSQNDSILSSAFRNRVSKIQVLGRGLVTNVLSDDNDGSRHQRLIVRLGSGQTILIAHNIDIAPRITSISVGDTLEFNGEYEWNPKGGVVHWTHRDPIGRHPAGWLKHNGKIYQ